MDELIRTVLSITFLILPFVGLYVTFVHRRWNKLHGPSPLLRHLYIASIALDIAAFSTMIVAVMLLLGVEIPRSVSSILVSSALYIALGVKIWRRFDLRALDHPGFNPEEPTLETDNQREDREFGEKRRRLEETHSANQE